MRSVSLIWLLFEAFAWEAGDAALRELLTCFCPLWTSDQQAQDSAISESLQSSARTRELANNEHSATKANELLSTFTVSPL